MKKDDFGKLYFSKYWYPENETDFGYQAVQQGESLGDFDSLEEAIECLEKWLLENGELTYRYSDKLE